MQDCKERNLFPVRAHTRHFRGAMVSALLHVLPKGFTRIRHYGFLAGCCRTQCLARIRKALAVAEASADEHAAKRNGEIRVHPCPLCKIGHLRLIGEVLPRPTWPREIRRR